ncbi:hypothetical protein [Sandaracinus amylolyticus]|uniref:hypothetical protein n=1 Tax=Sandaracinus amylolyticus TaxID=927083 RepID=UPI00069FCE9B|nr:hypothetical protein [Sandaracinus amylolyticus]
MSEDSARPLAHAGREEQARELFPYREQTPEEYAARHFHEWMCFSFDEFRYSDPELDAWIARLGQIFFERPGAPSVEELRARFLTPEEIEAIHERDQEELRSGTRA